MRSLDTDSGRGLPDDAPPTVITGPCSESPRTNLFEVTPVEPIRLEDMDGEPALTRAAAVMPVWDEAPSARPGDDMPKVGERFLEFELMGELGRGAFGRVFLARQASLAGRLMAVKVSGTSMDESQTLAQMQHTHIVPIYSVHRVGRLQAVVMPFFGATTLSDVVRDRRALATVPESGSQFISTLRGRRSDVAKAIPSSVAKPSSARPRPAGESGPAPVDLPALPDETPELGRLASSSFVEATLWLGARLADGLAHAHSRGIIHRDLKPANVLLTDDGQPMLLDFNLADEVAHAPEPGRVGGTLPYMAPEQLETFRDGTGRVDGRADVYALGLILYELLSGKPAFPVDLMDRDPVGTMLAARRAGVPSLERRVGISAGVAAIIAKCLEYDLARRYPSAHALAHDIELHLTHRPTALALNPSRRERFAMWAKRHPKLTSGGSIAAIALVLLTSLAGFAVARSQRVGALEAAKGAENFHAARVEAMALMSAGLSGGLDAAEGVRRSEALLASYGVGGPGWQERPAYRRLDAAARERFRHGAAELAFVAARAVSTIDPDRAARFGDLAERLYGPDEVPHPVRRLAAQFREQPAPPKPDRRLTGEELYLEAVDSASRGEHEAASGFARTATERDPKMSRAWFVLAGAEFALGHHDKAEAAYSTCLALSPESDHARCHRGIARIKLADPSGALADLDATLDRRPDWVDALFNRALARDQSGDARGAIDDLDRAVKLAPGRTQLVFLRSRLLRKVGRTSEADADLRAGLATTPTDPISWVSRGHARMGREPEKALADFDAALELHPTDRYALTGKAHLLCERLNRPAEGLAALDLAVKHHPDLAEARVGRAVVHARAGRRPEAIADAQATLLKDRSPRTLFQLASVYAAFPDIQPGDRDEALRLLASALRQEFGHDILETDPDLAALRDSPEFRALAAGVRALRGPRTPASP